MPETKRCSRCGLVMPLDQFTSQGKSTRPHCRSCAVLEDRVDRARYRARLRVDGVVAGAKNGSSDPVAFSRAACQHVKDYVERAIQRWESAAEIEAPPHVMALQQIASNFLKEHPKGKRCVECGSASIPLASSARRCRPCADARAKQKRREYNKRWKAKQREIKRKQRSIERQRAAARRLRDQGHTWREIADRLGISGPGQAYNYANSDTYLAYGREYHRRRRAENKRPSAAK